MRFVLDTSVAMRWLKKATNTTDQAYAERVLHSLKSSLACVPQLFPLEVSNVLLKMNKNGDITERKKKKFIEQMNLLELFVDPETARNAMTNTLMLAEKHNLTSYDASYLELAVRSGVAIATLDKNLRKAAHKAGVDIYLLG